MAAWSLQVIPYWFAYLAFPGLPNGIAKRLEKIRLGAETIIQDTEKLAKKYWDKPALKKTQPLIYFENHFFQISLASFLKKTKKKLYTPNIQLSKKTLTGIGAYSGKAHGKVKIVLDAKHIRTMRKGDVLVAPNTTPEYLPAMRKAAAIITNEGGMLCHAAIVSRELKIPCIIGTKIATKVLQDGDMVEVDANKGMVKIIKRKK